MRTSKRMPAPLQQHRSTPRVPAATPARRAVRLRAQGDGGLAAAQDHARTLERLPAPRNRAGQGRALSHGRPRLVLQHADALDPLKHLQVGWPHADQIGAALAGVGAERDDALEVLVLPWLELVAAGADRAGGRRGAQEGDLLVGRGRQVDQVLLQHPLDPEPAGVDGAERLGPGAAAVDDPAQGVVDHTGGTARLGDDDIPGGHGTVRGLEG
jgi:hypothetical protein